MCHHTVSYSCVEFVGIRALVIILCSVPLPHPVGLLEPGYLWQESCSVAFSLTESLNLLTTAPFVSVPLLSPRAVLNLSFPQDTSMGVLKSPCVLSLGR